MVRLAVLLAVGVMLLARSQNSVAPDRLQESIPPLRDVEQFVDSQFAEYLQRSSGPSLAIVIIKDGHVLLEKGYGSEDDRRLRPVDPALTAFNIASVSKVLTATAAMQQVQEGRLSLDAEIATYLHDVKVDWRGTTPVTVRALLTHTSGLDGPFLRDVVATPADLVPLDAYFRRFPPVAARPSGAEIRYSNYGMALVGHLVEVVSGQPFSDYIEQRIFRPLGMTRSSFRQPPPESIQSRTATAGSGPVPDALLPYPAGSAVSTVRDMGRLLQLHLNGGRVGNTRILREDTLQMMQSTQWAADPRVPGVALGLFETDLGSIRGLFHTGARTHFSLFYVAPKHSLGIYLVHSMRQGGPFQNLRTNFVRAFLAKYVHSRPDRTVTRNPMTPAEAHRYSGVYRPLMLSQSNIERATWMALDTHVTAGSDGILAITIPGGPKLNAVPAGSGLYEVQGGAEEGMKVVFSGPSACCAMRMSLSGATQDPLSFDRLSWLDRGLLHALVLGSVLLLFTGCLLWNAASVIIARLRRGSGDRGQSVQARRARLAWRMAVLTSAFALLAPVSVVAMVTLDRGDDTAAHNLRLALTVGLTWLLAAALAALTLPIFAIRAWRELYWSLPRRLYFTGLALGALVSIPLLYYHRLLGYWISL